MTHINKDTIPRDYYDVKVKILVSATLVLEHQTAAFFFNAFQYLFVLH